MFQRIPCFTFHVPRSTFNISRSNFRGSKVIMVAKPRNMAAVYSSVAFSKFRYLKGTVGWIVRLLISRHDIFIPLGAFIRRERGTMKVIVWHSRRWKLYYCGRPGGSITTVPCNILKLNYFNLHRPRWVKFLFMVETILSSRLRDWWLNNMKLK